ncbi:LRR receptor-like serine/threonine-protein kinase GSO2 [Prunus yedoensis var. nudiflora]|uniref:LRR receptor-like serine/threonine-protein kinase GSO2 n=1 Tax=Prunus yedoensis var. nudiflora TaxID=2094558 RepID=A0A314ZHT0_PRUYE|nr:LRR receptor-like serine/threonine-protein kinase GSO2 [Prunus yedoensis var. nudiflora]
MLSLKHLNYLDLSYNDFDEIHIPKFLGQLKSLRYLNISSASFSGEIPPSFGNLSNLNYLDLSEQSGYSLLELPSNSLNWLSHLSSLKYLNLGGVNLSSTGVSWVHDVIMLPSLVELHLSSCKIESLSLSMQSNINFTSSLLVLDMSYNNFDSFPFSTWLFNLTSLIKLDLSMNSFSGPFPSELASLKSLEYLDLSFLGLTGQIPRAIGNLCKLKTLSLRSNNFDGEGIEEFWRSLLNCPNNTMLESVDMSACGLGGKLPASLGMLKSLQYLDLGGNNFWGSIPESIGNLSSLKKLDLSDNHMNGSILESIGHLSSLKTLSLYENYIIGSIPVSIGNLSSLKILELSSNCMNGSIPETLGKLSELVELHLSRNPWKDILTEAHFINLTRLKYLSIYSDEIEKPISLIFNMAYDWVPPFKLHTIEIANCRIGPGIGAWLQSQTELSSAILRNNSISDSIPAEWFLKISSQVEYLDLSYNTIFGKLPFQLKFPNIQYVKLGHNQFEGPFPLWSTDASFLDLESNLFSGPIPSNLDQLMPKLRQLYVSDNRLSGTIPTSICNIKDMKVVSLKNNTLFGEFPQHWSLWSGIEVIDVAHNNLSGNIPSSMGIPSSLRVLKVKNNSFGGEIPFSLQNCTFLRILHLGGNKFTGNLPLWIGSNVTTLQLLQLRQNLLSGHIPQQFCNLPYLHVLDLGHNRLSGTIPKCLKNMTSLAQADAKKLPVQGDDIRYFYDEYYGQTTITSKGKELEYRDFQLITLAKSIDLSSNSFEGEIPEEVGSLHELGTLNLSMNGLTGEIPSSIGNLHWLETLDLSHNRLSGRIPQSFSSLTSLSHLKLSDNNLIGKIPSGNQLQTLDDPSIYEGNPSLCGAPLSTLCPVDDTSTGQTFPAEDHSKDNKEVLWFYASTTLGFIIGFWGVCGTLVVKKSWRYAYFQFFDNVREKATLTVALKAARWQGRL